MTSCSSNFKRMLRLGLILIAWGAGLTSCSWLQPAVGSGEVLFQDDFSLTSSGWDRYRDETYEADYADGAYRIRVFTPRTMVWSLPDVNLQEVRIVVEARSAAGSSDNLFGTICRYENADNFIFFIVSSDGFAGIGRYLDGERQLLTDESLLPTDAIPDNEARLTLTSVCSGRDLRLEINGESVAQIRIAQATNGDIGLLAGTYDSPDVTIEFDNLSVTNP
jgi:hypothetical protein